MAVLVQHLQPGVYVYDHDHTARQSLLLVHSVVKESDDSYLVTYEWLNRRHGTQIRHFASRVGKEEWAMTKVSLAWEDIPAADFVIPGPLA